MTEKIVQTAGREQLGDFAPMFAHLNDDVLFGEVWNEDALDIKTKCVVTVVSLMASGVTDASLVYHLENAKAHGVTKDEIAAIITHATMYVGWPKGWAVFRLAKEVWNEPTAERTEKDKYQNTIFFPIGEPNDGFAKYFIGQSYLAPISTEPIPIFISISSVSITVFDVYAAFNAKPYQIYIGGLRRIGVGSHAVGLAFQIVMGSEHVAAAVGERDLQSVNALLKHSGNVQLIGSPHQIPGLCSVYLKFTDNGVRPAQGKPCCRRNTGDGKFLLQRYAACKEGEAVLFKT